MITCHCYLSYLFSCKLNQAVFTIIFGRIKSFHSIFYFGVRREIIWYLDPEDVRVRYKIYHIRIPPTTTGTFSSISNSILGHFIIRIGFRDKKNLWAVANTQMFQSGKAWRNISKNHAKNSHPLLAHFSKHELQSRYCPEMSLQM
jgi:hypothetical protein